MPAVKRRARKKRAVDDAPLTRARIVEAGLALLAEHGADGLNMRALADALGTAPMSLYRHVRSKDDLSKAIVAMVLERHDFDVPASGPWTERVAGWMHALRAQLLRSPAVVSILMQHGHYAPALLRATNVLLHLLREAGFDGLDAVRASREIMWSTLGFVSAEIRGPTFSPSFYAQALREQAGAGADLADVAAHMPYLLTRDLDDVFAAIVRHLLAGLAAELAERAAPGAPPESGMTGLGAEREILFTGIGGQGIQLMAKVLADAVARAGRYAMLFGIYHGAMRGSPSDSTLVVGDAPIEAPPIVPACWSVIALHPQSLEPLLAKIRPGGFLFADDTLVETQPPQGVTRIGVPATRIAERDGNRLGAGMVMLGAFVGWTTLVALDEVVAAMRAALPTHRAKMADANAALLDAGAAWALSVRGDS